MPITNHQLTLNRLCHTLEASVSPYHGIQEAARQLMEAGYATLSLGDAWKLQANGRYLVNAFDSTLFAFSLGDDMVPGQFSSDRAVIRLAAAHTDWPCLKVKPSPEVFTGPYGKLNAEVYGSPILSTWLDRPLSAAGKVCVASQDPFAPEVLFIHRKQPVFTIPNLAIHMNREVNSKNALNPQIDMLPLAGIWPDTPSPSLSCRNNFFLDFLASEINRDPQDILDYEIYLYNPEPPVTLGLNGQLLSSPRLDNITSIQACITGLLEGNCQKGIQGIALYDNEEIGSATKQGARSMLLERILEKVFLSLGLNREIMLNSLVTGLLLSLDVAHAMHPNHPEKCDIKNQIMMGSGLALKLSSSQSYATDAAYASIAEGLCRSKNIPYQKFSNRSDIRGGSTLGTIASAMLNMPAIDAGVPILAMHSSRELMHIQDQMALEDLAAAFFGA